MNLKKYASLIKVQDIDSEGNYTMKATRDIHTIKHNIATASEPKASSFRAALMWLNGMTIFLEKWSHAA